MQDVFLKTDKAISVENLHEYLKYTFDFPDYYGGNLDSLYDCLTSISQRVNVIIPYDFGKVLNGYGEHIIRVFEDAEKYNKFLCVHVEQEEEPSKLM